MRTGPGDTGADVASQRSGADVANERSGDGPLLDVRDLDVFLPAPSGPVRIIDRVSFTVDAGRTTGLIGESGSGKTMTAMAVIGLLPQGAVTRGGLWWRGENLLTAGPRRRRRVRGREIAMIFQDPLASLNPSQTVGRQVTEIPRRDGMSRRELTATAAELLGRVGIPEPARRASNYPHQFSGGMRQRAMTALALAGKPRLILADEPTTALDVTVQARILDMLRNLREQENTAMVLVSHDLRVMAHVADDLVVMYAGRVCERGPARDLLRRPLHPYTKALVESVPAVHTKTAIAAPLPGSPANPAQRPSGCAFHPRCPLTRVMADDGAAAHERCRTEEPEVLEVAPGRWSGCHFAGVLHDERSSTRVAGRNGTGPDTATTTEEEERP
ncbi:ABC transporter ATP-binding protein [Phytoactinopolyspora halotolerans]|uniref:ABC transporter ATP-binding protein n=1 Tax=Phytoactinopolyspora halotolerans TaxID=1981512 RepID=A0A6L9S4Q9_9ACTN|nr:ABC transporter ATP-binding protein [Phytoactinopolyspora halotolerans]NEE00089.1 ABC transporter ATP-binding protein [Phytoactinopolyspora halotolerans]